MNFPLILEVITEAEELLRCHNAIMKAADLAREAGLFDTKPKPVLEREHFGITNKPSVFARFERSQRNFDMWGE